MDLRSRSDARAVRRVLSGHREAFGALVTRYQSLVYHVALSHAGNPADAEDLTQEAPDIEPDSKEAGKRIVDSLRGYNLRFAITTPMYCLCGRYAVEPDPV